MPEKDKNAPDAPHDSPEVTQAMDSDIARGTMTITQFMDRHGIKGGVSLDDSQKTPSTAESLLATDKARRYEIGKIVARGGMGAILRAKDLSIRRNVAMKVMLDPKKEDQAKILRFIEEGQVTGQLEHPGIVPVYELGVDISGNVFYTMKFVSGITLKDILQRIRDRDAKTIHEYPLSRLLTIFQRVCEAMAYAHHRGVVHRDLKPENIMIGEFGEVQVMDWGLAKILKDRANEKRDEEGIQTSSVDSVRGDELGEAVRTIDGQVMGTPQFMAPEQALGKIGQIDARTDIYSLGAILYNVLTLRPPITGKNLGQVLLKVSRGDITPPVKTSPPAAEKTVDDLQKRASGAAVNAHDRDSTPESGFPHCPNGAIPPALSAVAMKALALEQGERYPASRDLQADIDRYQTGFATTAEDAGLARQLLLLVKRHRGFVAAAVLLFLAVTVGLLVSLAQRHKAILAKQDAQAQRDAANTAREEAVSARDRAQASEARAVQSEHAALTAKAAAEKAAYRANLELAVRHLDGHNYVPVRDLLDSCSGTLRDWEWGYLARQARLEEQRWLAWQGHQIAFSRDGCLKATSTSAPKIKLCRTGAEGTETVWLDTGRGADKRLAFLGDGARLAALLIAPSHGALQVFDTATGERLQDWPGNYTSKATLAASPNGRFAVTTHGDSLEKPAEVWDLDDGHVVCRLGTDERHCSAAWSPDNRFVVIGCRRGVQLFEVDTWKAVPEFRGPEDRVRHMVFTADGTRLVTGSYGGMVHIWQVPSGKCELPLSGCQKRAQRVLATPDGKHILAAESGRVFVWSAETGNVLATIPLAGRTQITCLLQNPSSNEVWVSCIGPTLRLDLKAVLSGGLGHERSRVPAGDQGVRLSPDGNTILVGTSWAEIDEEGRPSPLTPLQSSLVPNDVAWAPDGTRCAIGEWCGTTVEVHDRSGGAPRILPGSGQAQGSRGVSVSFVNNRTLVAADQNHDQIWVWDVDTAQRVTELPDVPKLIWDLAVSPDGRILVAATKSGLALWSTQDWRRLDWPGDQPMSWRVEFSPTGDRLVVAGTEVVEVWNVEERRRLSRTEAGHSDRVSGIVFFPGGQRFATTGWDGKLTIWDASDVRPIVTFQGPAGVFGAALGPRGTRLYCLEKGKTLLVREADPWQ